MKWLTSNTWTGYHALLSPPTVIIAYHLAKTLPKCEYSLHRHPPSKHSIVKMFLFSRCISPPCHGSLPCCVCRVSCSLPPTLNHHRYRREAALCVIVIFSLGKKARYMHTSSSSLLPPTLLYASSPSPSLLSSSLLPSSLLSLPSPPPLFPPTPPAHWQEHRADRTAALCSSSYTQGGIEMMEKRLLLESMFKYCKECTVWLVDTNV